MFGHLGGSVYVCVAAVHRVSEYPLFCEFVVVIVVVVV